jgi:MFS family permease
MSESSAKPDPYAPWRSPDYRRLAGSWFAMTFSKQVETLAASVYFVNVYDPIDALLALGLMGLVQALPIMLLAIAGGQLADRFDRRNVMMATLSLSVLSSAGLVVSAWLGGAATWIYVLLALGAVGQALGSPSRAALLPQLVPSELFSNAVMWNSSVFYIASVTGPIVGGLIVGKFENPAPAFALVFVCRLAGVAAVTLIRHRRTSRVEQSVSWESVLAGIRFVLQAKLILATITLDLFAVLLGGATYLLPYYAKYILQVGPAGLGFLRSADAVGAVCMAVFLAHSPPMRHAGRMMLWAVAGFGAATIVFGLSQWFWLSLLVMFLVGALDNISVVVRHTLVQMLTPDEMRGRVSAVNSVFIVASNDLGGLESGLTAWCFGPVVSVVAGGVGAILVVLGVMRLWPEILKIGSLDSIQPASPTETDREA